MAHRSRRAAPPSTPPRGRVSLWHALVVAILAMAAIVWLRRTTLDVKSSRSADSAKAAASTTATAEASTFVGAETCAACHSDTSAQWRESMHARAMTLACPATVKAPFANERFTAGDVTSTFSRSKDRFVVRTDGPDGALHDFDVAYTFGVEPLQQYLLPLPGGRYQALSVSWDTRSKAAGGQRWFHLYAQSHVPAGDVLHWTSPSQNWNARCAECHSTNLRKGYDAAQNTYKTTWSDINVACEACHGAGSRHVAWARGRTSKGPRASGEDDGLVPLDGKDGATWTFDPATGIAHRNRPRTSHVEVEMCARCHARRAVLTDDYQVGRPLTDTHRPSLLEEGLYFADGQI